MSHSRWVKRRYVLSVAVFACVQVEAAIDVITTYVGSNKTVNMSTNLLGGATYNSTPGVDTAYTSNSGAGGGFRAITDVSGAKDATTLVTETSYQEFMRDDANFKATNTLPTAIVLNPKSITFQGTNYAPGTLAIIADQGRTNNPDDTANDAHTKRIYAWNLQAPQPGQSGTTVLKSIMTKAQYAAAAVPGSGNDQIGGRQFAFSADGQSIYSTDGTTGWGGLYKIGLTDGAVTKILSERGSARISAEAAVRAAPGGGDRVFFDGASGIGNANGVSYIDYTGTPVSSANTLITANTIKSFLNTTATITVNAIATDPANDDLYFSVFGGTTADGTRRVALLRYDAQQRLSKVTSFNEQISFFVGGGLGNPTAGMSKLQPRRLQIGSGENAFTITEILYIEASTAKTIAGVKAYAPGDFTRDGRVDQADVAALTATNVIKTRNSTITDSSLFKFDMNADANSVATASTPTALVDYLDVKTFQQFYAFHDGDANIDQVVDSSDFTTLAANFNQSGKIWTQGDFNGDNVVNALDFNALATHYGMPPPTLPGAALGALVPEPCALGLVAGIGAWLSVRRRSNRRN